MYVYVRRIWLGDGRDVRLVSYQRDLGVWMFPGVRRVGFLSAISLKMLSLYLNKTNALDSKKKKKKKINSALLFLFLTTGGEPFYLY